MRTEQTPPGIPRDSTRDQRPNRPPDHVGPGRRAGRRGSGSCRRRFVIVPWFRLANSTGGPEGSTSGPLFLGPRLERFMPAPLALSETSRRCPESPITFFMRQALENPSMISLAAGLVDLRLVADGRHQEGRR